MSAENHDRETNNEVEALQPKTQPGFSGGTVTRPEMPTRPPILGLESTATPVHLPAPTHEIGTLPVPDIEVPSVVGHEPTLAPDETPLPDVPEPRQFPVRLQKEDFR